MGVWVVKRIYFNGEGDSVSVAAVFSTEAKAEAWAAKKNSERVGSYADSFEVDWDEFVVDAEV